MATVMKPRWELLLVVTNDRYGSDRFDTVRRLIDAAIRGGRSVQIWACGACNTLTEQGSGSAEACCGADGNELGSTTVEYISELLATFPDRFSWVACRTCSDDRGGGGHITGALTEPGFANFKDYVDNAAKTVYIGGA